MSAMWIFLPLSNIFDDPHPSTSARNIQTYSATNKETADLASPPCRSRMILEVIDCKSQACGCCGLLPLWLAVVEWYMVWIVMVLSYFAFLRGYPQSSSIYSRLFHYKHLPAVGGTTIDRTPPEATSPVSIRLLDAKIGPDLAWEVKNWRPMDPCLFHFLVCSLSLIEKHIFGYIHPASRGVTAHTAGFFFGPWQGLSNLHTQLFTTVVFLNICACYLHLYFKKLRSHPQPGPSREFFLFSPTWWPPKLGNFK